MGFKKVMMTAMTKSIMITLLATMMIIISSTVMIQSSEAVEFVDVDLFEDKDNIIDVVHEDLDTDVILKKQPRKKGSNDNHVNGNLNMDDQTNANDNNQEEFHVEFNAFGEDHKITLRTHHNDDELASAFGDNYGMYSMDQVKNAGNRKLLKNDDENTLGDIDTIRKCIYKGEREDGAVAIYITCKGLDQLLISNSGDGEHDEQIEVKKDKKTGKMKASKTRFSSLNTGKKRHHTHTSFAKNNDKSKNKVEDGHDRQLAENECTKSPQKYLSLVLVHAISRVKYFATTTELEAHTLFLFLGGKMIYDRTTTPLGCNVKIRLAGQLYETPTNKIINERFCNEIEPELAAVEVSHNANNGANGCCSRFPIVWENCNNGETKCWNANAPNNPESWSKAIVHPMPGVDFTKDGGCYQYWSNGVWKSDDETKSVKYYQLKSNDTLSSNSEYDVDVGLYLHETGLFFENNAKMLRDTFGDVDNVQAWTHNYFYDGVIGLAWTSNQCYDYLSTAVVCSVAGPGLWVHEMGHNLGMGHEADGVMGGRRLGTTQHQTLSNKRGRYLIDYFGLESKLNLQNFLINTYANYDDTQKCLEDGPTKAPTSKPTLKPGFIPTKKPISLFGDRCDPYVCGGSNCAAGLSCHKEGFCHDWNGGEAYENCIDGRCNEGLSCHPETEICMPCSGTASPTIKQIPGKQVGDKCNPKECGASNCDPELTCDSDGLCKRPGVTAVGGNCKKDYCQKGLSCNPLSNTCNACPATNAPVAPNPTKKPARKPNTPKPTTAKPTPRKPPTRSPVSADACTLLKTKGKCKKVDGCTWDNSSKTCINSI